MKKLVACIAAIMIGIGVSNAKDKFYIGGNLGFWYNDDAVTATLAPEFGYKINKAWSIGTQIGYSYVGSGDIDVSLFEISPYVRWNYVKAGIVELFVDGGFDFGFGAMTAEYDMGTVLYPYTYKETETIAAFGVGFKPGITINVTNQFSLVAHFGFIGYKGVTESAEDLGIKKGFGIDLTNSVSFGFFYKF